MLLKQSIYLCVLQGVWSVINTLIFFNYNGSEMYFPPIFIDPTNINNTCIWNTHTHNLPWHACTYSDSTCFKLDRLSYCSVIQRWILNGHSIPCKAITDGATYTLGPLVSPETAMGQEGSWKMLPAVPSTMRIKLLLFVS